MQKIKGANVETKTKEAEYACDTSCFGKYANELQVRSRLLESD